MNVDRIAIKLEPLMDVCKCDIVPTERIANHYLVSAKMDNHLLLKSEFITLAIL